MMLWEEVLHVPIAGTLLGIFLVLFVVSLHLSTHTKGKEPPGPRPLPLLGNLLQLDLRRPYHSLCKLSKRYGSVFTVYFGPKKVVVLAGYKTVKEALVNFSAEFGSRDITPAFYMFSKNHGIPFANGDGWREMRRFALANLRDMGMGKRGAEEKIIEEIHYMTEVFESHNGLPFDNKQALNRSVGNIISSIVFGKRFDYADKRFQEMVQLANDRIRLVGTPAIQIYNAFPWLGKCLKDYQNLVKSMDRNYEVIKQTLQKIRGTLNSTDRRCFVGAFLIRQREMMKYEEKSGFSDENLIHTVSTLFGGGTNTTASTLRWGLLLMAKNPDIQERVQEELVSVIGGRQPRSEDRKNLPYTEAVVHEIQRVANVLPMSLPHTTTCDVVFQGYHIKKGTSVCPLLTSVLYDESEWESPLSFNPGHFLDEQGQFVKREAFLPFSAGRRACLGESLAKMELFLFFSSLLQRFRFTPPPGVSESDLDLTPAVGFSLNPVPHKLCALSRATV